MTRGEQINKESLLRLNMEYNAYEAFGFRQGAEWADSNPNWHKWPDEKPPIDKLVLCLTNKGIYVVLKWVCYKLDDGTIKGEGWSDNRYGNNIAAWIELPKPPKFD